MSLLPTHLKSDKDKAVHISDIYPLFYSLQDEDMEGIQPNGVIITC